MKIQTKYLGEVELSEENILHFSSGIPGFIEETSFTLLDLPGNSVFQLLQSTFTPGIAFVVTNPYHFYHEYEFELDANIKEILQINSEKDVVVFAIVTLQEPFNNSTLNLKAPVIINPTSKLGKQYILNDERHITKASIIQPISSTKVRGK